MSLQFLQKTVDMHRSMERPNWPYSCSEEFVLKHGRAYVGRELPKGYKKGIPKHCFYNSFKLVKRRKKLRYVEGYAFFKGIPILHAWVVEAGSFDVIELTHSFDSYFGVCFETDYLLDQWRQFPDGLSLLDNYESKYALLQMTPEEVQKVLYPFSEEK